MAAFVSSLAGAGGPASAASEPWPMFQHDARHTGRSAVNGPLEFAVKWTFPTEGEPGTPAVAADGTIYLPAGMLNEEDFGDPPQPGYVYAIRANGTQKWRYDLPGTPSSTAPAIGSDGTIYVHANGSGNIASINNLSAVNPNGSEKWTFQFGGGAASPSNSDHSSPAIGADGSVWVGSSDTVLYKLDPADADIRCAVSPTASSISSSPAIAPDGTVYVVDATTTLFAFEPDCDPKWNFQLSDNPTGTGNPQSPTVASNGTIWVGSPVSDRLYAVNPNGTFKCSFQTGDSIVSTPAIGADGTVYVGSDGLYAVNPTNCAQKWKFEDPLFSSASPVIGADGTIYWRESFTAYAVNPNGTQRWATGFGVVGPGTGGNHPSGAIAEEGVLYFADGGFSNYPSRLRAIADTTPPDTAITSGPAGPTNDNTATFTFTSTEGGSTFQCRVDGAPFAACASPHTTAPLADGAHTFNVQATDGAGNVDPTPAARAFTVDTVAPETTITSGPTGVTNDATPTFSFTSTEAGSTFECRVDGGAFAPCASPHTTPALADGAHTFNVRATDGAGNTDPTPAARAFTVDTVAPETTITSGPTGVTNDATPTFSFTSTEAGSTFECRVDAGAFASCASPHTTPALADGAHTFNVRATDGAGNTDPTPAARAFTVDAQAPQTTITAGPTGPTNDSTPTFSFSSSEPGSTLECRVDGAAYAPCTSPRTIGPLADGPHTFNVRATDGAGNTDPTPAAAAFTVDTDPPETTITGGPSGRTRDRTPTFRFVSDEENSTFRCKLDRRRWRACTSPREYGRVTLGRHVFRVRSTDQADNRDETPAVRTFRVVT